MPIYLCRPPPPPPPLPAVQKERVSLHILVLSDFILPLPGRSGQEWGLSDMIDCFAFLFASWNPEKFFFLPLSFSFPPPPPRFTSVNLFFSKRGTSGSLVQKFLLALLWNWFESLVYELVCFSHSLPPPPPPPPPPVSAELSLTHNKNSTMTFMLKAEFS